jgi:D-arginine dehydrogenase
MSEHAEFVIIGAGIAGASVAAELAGSASVVLLEREHQPGYHSTGRSAAVFTEIYGNAIIRGLSVATGRFLADPPEGFSEHPLLHPRPLLMIAREDQLAELRALHDEAVKLVPSIRVVGREELKRLAPMLRGGYAAAALIEPQSCDLDVHAIHSGFLRAARKAGAKLVQNAEVRALRRGGEGWTVETAAGDFSARVVVNAAGAWADEVAALAGAKPIGLVPKRRTAFTFTFAPERSVADWPTVIDISEQFYFKPEGARLLGSPADETPSPPCDAQPEELDIALAIDRIGQAADFEIRSVDSKWAGLRSFVADKTPVVGYDDRIAGFFWLAAQGGYGIQTSAALGRAAAALLKRQSFPRDLEALGVTAAALSPQRLRIDGDGGNAGKSTE